MSNELPNLGSVITIPAARRVIYTTYVVAVFGAGACSAAFAISAGGNPEWLNVANAVLLYAGIPVGGLAIANSPSKAQVEIIETGGITLPAKDSNGYEG